jgi:hypothetical protein
MFCGYAIASSWWDVFWGELTSHNRLGDCNHIDNTPLIKSIKGDYPKVDEMYHYLSSDLTKLNLENWQNFEFDDKAMEKRDYVIVSQLVWKIIQK